MTKQELDEILHKVGTSEQVIELATTPGRLFILLSQLQLALRHPGNTGASTEIAREMAHNLANMICHYIPEARPLIEMGWHPEFDQTREEFGGVDYEYEYDDEGDRP